MPLVTVSNQRLRRLEPVSSTSLSHARLEPHGPVLCMQNLHPSPFTLHPSPFTLCPQPQTTNHKPQTTNAKPQTTNHKPQTTNHKPLNPDPPLSAKHRWREAYQAPGAATV
eukprot:3785801-Rhodomonas_salina.1